MRLPSMMTPLLVYSTGACLVHGLYGSGYRTVEKTFTTEFSIALDRASAPKEESELVAGPDSSVAPRVEPGTNRNAAKKVATRTRQAGLKFMTSDAKAEP